MDNKQLINDEAVTVYNEENGLLKGFYHSPGPKGVARFLALNHALEMHGPEHCGHIGERGFAYLNTGDMYGATLIQFDGKNSIFISSVGDVVECGNYR